MVAIMNLAEKLNKYSKDYWDFQDYRKEAPLVRYPAIMVAPMQECILREVINADSSIKNVLDPFSGSGTVLVEGQKLGLDVIGLDINPLAILLTQVQLEGVPANEIDTHNADLFARIVMLNGNVKPLCFTNVKKWFTDEVIASLSVIRQEIMGENDDRIRRFYWCCFAETVKKYSNTRTSTFKLHIKDEKHIAAQIDDSIDFFFYMKVPNDFEPISDSFTEDNCKEFLRWVSLDENIIMYPTFFRTELKNPTDTVRHFVTDER